LQAKTTYADTQTASWGTAQRRKEERIQTPFPATVRGVDINREAFEVTTVVDNLSAGGLYLRLVQHVEEGAKMSVSVRLSTSPVVECPGPVVLLHSKVLRVEPKPGGIYGLALSIIHSRFL